MFFLGLEGVVEGGSTDAGGKTGSTSSEDCSDSATAGRLRLLVVMDDRSGLLLETSCRGLVYGLLRVSAGVTTARVSYWGSRESLDGLNRIAGVWLNRWESPAETSRRNVVTMGTVSVTGNDSTRCSESWRSALVGRSWLESWITASVRWRRLVEAGVQIRISLSRIRRRWSMVSGARRIWRRCIVRDVPSDRRPSGLLRGRGRNRRDRLGWRRLVTRRIAQLCNVRTGVTPVRSRLGNATADLTSFAHLDQVGRAQQQT